MNTIPTAQRSTEAQGSESEARALKLWVVLARAHAAVAAHSTRDIMRHGLSVGEFGVLEALYHRGPMLQGELQQRILVSSGGVTYLVDRLTAKGLVERRDCPTDRRARYAALTPEGEALIESIFPAHAKSMERAVSGLNEDEQRQAIELLRKLGLAAAVLEPPPEPRAARAPHPHPAAAAATEER